MMYKQFIRLLFSLWALVLFSACNKDFLDKGPLDQYSDANVWTDSTLLMRYVDGIYGSIHSIYDDAGSWLPMDITDEGKAARSFLICNQINNGQYNSSDNIYQDRWQDVYANVRKCNQFMAHLEDMPLSEQLKQRLVGEVRFLRALNYMQPYSLFGPFPIVDKVLTLKDELAIPRGTAEACVAFINEDLEAAAAALPVQYAESTDLGRATRGACLGMQCRLLLNDKDYAGAAKAAKAVMGLGVYQLFEGGYAEMFYPENDDNVEVIFNKEYAGDLSNQVHDLDLYDNSSFFTGFSSLVDVPTQNMVDNYEMTDGKTAAESDSYNPEHPYENRDPRFYASIIYDGASWLGNTMDLIKGSKYNPTSRPSPTGYMLRKFLNPNYAFNESSNSNYQNCIMLRLSEIYLNYAEAEFKLGNIEEARIYVNKIRSRKGVDMPEIPPGQMTWEKYVRERTVELAFEGQRFNDIRRWEMGPALIGADIKAMLVQQADGKRQYTVTSLEKRYFDPKMYYFPIPKGELNKYPAGKVLEQNPGWD